MAPVLSCACVLRNQFQALCCLTVVNFSRELNSQRLASRFAIAELLSMVDITSNLRTKSNEP